MPTPPRPLPTPPGDEVPPLEGDDADDVDGIVGDRDAPLTPNDDSAPDFDDELPTDPSFDIDFASDVDHGEIDAPVDLPVGPDFAPRDEQPTIADDLVGFVNDIDLGLSANDFDDRTPHELGDGVDDEHFRVDDTALPALDGDDGPELDPAGLGVKLESADEAPLPHLETPWRIDFIAPDREHVSALCAAQGVVVAGSSDLFWLDEGRETVVRIALDGTRISSIAVVGEKQKTALCVTAFGRLLRRARLGGDVERLVDWRRVAEATGSSAEGLELRALGPERPNSVLGRLTSGRLVRSDDMGTTFRMLDADVTALTLSSSSNPIAILTRNGERLALSSNGGSSFEQRELVSPAREIAAGEAPLVAATGDVIAIGEAERGIAVSADRGATFRRVAGASNVTALSAGLVAGKPRVFAALYRETDDRSLLVDIDPVTAAAATGAVLSLPAAEDPDAALELGRVERLLWDGERLWAAGAFGLAMIRR